MALLQSVSAPNTEEDLILMSLLALDKIMAVSIVTDQKQDLEFECLTTLLNLICSGKVKYSEAVTKKTTEMIANLSVSSESNHIS